MTNSIHSTEVARVFNGDAGTGIISGTTKINGVLAPCRVSISSVHGENIATFITKNDGAYSIEGVPKGVYRIIVEDMKNYNWKGKLEYVLVT